MVNLILVGAIVTIIVALVLYLFLFPVECEITDENIKQSTIKQTKNPINMVISDFGKCSVKKQEDCKVNYTLTDGACVIDEATCTGLQNDYILTSYDSTNKLCNYSCVENHTLNVDASGNPSCITTEAECTALRNLPLTTVFNEDKTCAYTCISGYTYDETNNSCSVPVVDASGNIYEKAVVVPSGKMIELLPYISETELNSTFSTSLQPNDLLIIHFALRFNDKQVTLALGNTNDYRQRELLILNGNAADNTSEARFTVTKELDNLLYMMLYSDQNTIFYFKSIKFFKGTTDTQILEITDYDVKSYAYHAIRGTQYCHSSRFFSPNHESPMLEGDLSGSLYQLTNENGVINQYSLTCDPPTENLNVKLKLSKLGNESYTTNTAILLYEHGIHISEIKVYKNRTETFTSITSSSDTTGIMFDNLYPNVSLSTGTGTLPYRDSSVFSVEWSTLNTTDNLEVSIMINDCRSVQEIYKIEIFLVGTQDDDSHRKIIGDLYEVNDSNVEVHKKHFYLAKYNSRDIYDSTTNTWNSADQSTNLDQVIRYTVLSDKLFSLKVSQKHQYRIATGDNKMLLVNTGITDPPLQAYRRGMWSTGMFYFLPSNSAQFTRNGDTLMITPYTNKNLVLKDGSDTIYYSSTIATIIDYNLFTIKKCDSSGNFINDTEYMKVYDYFMLNITGTSEYVRLQSVNNESSNAYKTTLTSPIDSTFIFQIV